MGQSLSRRPASKPASAPTTVPRPQQSNDSHPPRRSLSRRILSSIPKPSLRSRSLASSLTLPTRPEQTLRGKNRRWRLSRRHNVPASVEGAVPERMGRLTEHEEHQVDRDVDEFGVITPRVPDNHNDSSAASAKGKERAKDVDVEDDNEVDHRVPIPSTSTAPPLAQSGVGRNPAGDDEVVIAPTAPSPPARHSSPLPPVQQPERLFVPLPSEPTPPSSPQPSIQQTNTSPRPFPPPGTLVVVQGVVHTTDVPRSSDRPLTTPSTIPLPTYDPLNSSTNTDPSSTRPSSVPPESRSRNPLSSILPRPTSMVPSVPPPSGPTIGPSMIESQAGQTTSNVSGTIEDSEDEDRMRTHPHGFSMAQGPVGASGLSASSIDVLGTLLSVAAAATAASLLTGSSEPIFSSGLTSSQPPPPSFPQPGFNSNVPSERPLSPTPTSDAGRMRHVWSSLRDRLGLGSGTHNSSHSNDNTLGLGSAQATPSQPSDVTRSRDPREIMLAEMARAFNLGLGLGGGTTNTPSATVSANPDTTELAMADGGDIDRDREQSSLPPPDSFERFLMDLQTDLRVTLTQEQEPSAIRGIPQDVDEIAEDVEGDRPIPELQSLSDSDSEDSETRHFESDDEDCEDHADNEGDEGDARTAQEQLSGRTSPAVSALGAGTQYQLGAGAVGTAFSASGMHTAPSRPTSTAIPPNTDCEISGNNPSTDNGENGDIGISRASSSVSNGICTHIPADGPSSSEMRSEEEPGGREERAVLGAAHSRDASKRGQVEAEGSRAVSGSIPVLPLDAEDPSNVPETCTGQDSLLPGTSSRSGPSTSDAPHSFAAGQASSIQPPTQLPTTALPLPLNSGRAIRASSVNPAAADSPMPFRLPFTPSSASRTEHTPGGGINWWRMYRFPAITSPNLGSQGGPQGSSLPPSQPPLRSSAQGPNHSSPWAGTTDQNQQNEIITSRGVAQVPEAHSGLAAPALTPSGATPTNMPEIVSVSSQGTSTPASAGGQDSNRPTNTSAGPPEHRSNVVVPVIVVGLQSVNMDRQAPHIPHPHANHTPAVDDEDGEGVELDGLEPPMSMPLHIPEPAEFRHHPGPLSQEQNGQQSSRGRTWQSRAANAIRNLRPSRRNADATSPPPQEAPGSRTFLIYVIGGYYPPDHQIITGGNLDSFEALWELAELLGQVKPPTVSKEEIEKSGLEVIKASTLGEYEKQGRVASNCIDRCLICLDDYIPEDDLRVLACKHTFHQGCVDRWLETGRNNCPACRTKGVGSEAVGPTSATSDAIA